MIREMKPSKVLITSRTGLGSVALGVANELGIPTERYWFDAPTHGRGAPERAVEQMLAVERDFIPICISPGPEHRQLLELLRAAGLTTVVGFLGPTAEVRWSRVPASQPPAHSVPGTAEPAAPRSGSRQDSEPAQRLRR